MPRALRVGLAGDLLLLVLIPETGRVAQRLRVREIDDDEGRRLARIIRRGRGSVVTWRRAQMVLLSAQDMDVAGIAKVAFTSEDRVRDVIRNVNADGFGSLYPRYQGGRPPTFTLAQRREIKRIAKSRPAEHGLPYPPGACTSLASRRGRGAEIQGAGVAGMAVAGAVGAAGGRAAARAAGARVRR